MLPAEHRMRRSQDFDLVVRHGSRKGRRHLVVHCLTRAAEAREAAGTTSEDNRTTRVGFIVSRAVGGAVVRNRVRRRLRAAVARHWDLVPDGAAVVVRALPASAAAQYADLDRDLVAGLRGACVDRSGR